MRTVQSIVAILLISAGVGFIFWPAGLICAGVLLLIDRIT